MREIMGNKKRENSAVILTAAFIAIYFIWGTTYLGIRFAIETIPPFFMGGTRFMAAGIVLFVWSYIKYPQKPGWTELRFAVLSGILMFFVGGGSVIWTEQYIPSGFAALVVATIPVWMVLFDWFYTRSRRPGTKTIIAIIFGISGVIFLGKADDTILIHSSINSYPVALNIIILSIGALSWAAGSIYTRHTKPTLPIVYISSIQMIAGGSVFFLAGLISGELSQITIYEISAISLISLLYLIIPGTLIAYISYIWLLKNSTPAKVGAYAFFNPLVAVIIGAVFAGEPVTSNMLLAAGFILLSLLLLNTNLLKYGTIKRIMIEFGNLKTKGL